MKKLRVAIIGCGRISIAHLVSIKALSIAELVACCDVIKERADGIAKEYGIKAYYDYEKMIREENLDAVHILLPHYLHAKVANFAFSMGVNVLSEKPMDVNYESAEIAVKNAKEKGVLYGVVSQCRYNNPVKFVKNVVESGKLGKIISASSTLTWARDESYYEDNDWKGTWDKEGGGVVINQAIHSIDIVNWIMDSEVESVSCTMTNRCHPYVEVEDCADGFITYKNGAKYSFWCMNNNTCDEPIEIKLHCENGKVKFGYDDAYIEYNDGTKEEAHQCDVMDYEGGKDYWGFQHVRQIDQFYKACLGLEPLEITGEEALKTHKLIMEIYKKGRGL